MKNIAILLLALCIVSCAFADKQEEEKLPKSIYDVAVVTIDGKNTTMASYKNKVVLIVNVASKCGYTYQYKGLQEVYAKYKDKDFVVLGFPANDFGKQEPGSNLEIQEFCTKKFEVSFPMFAKITVKGDKKHDLYKFLTAKKTNPKHSGEINWNFNKFLVDKKGNIVARYGSRSNPESKEVTKEIEAALAVKVEK